jgi:transcriptional regulator GlxA family with amidase domain
MSISAEDVADASIAVQGHAILGNDICSRRIPPQHIARAKQLLAELRAVATAPHPFGNKAAVAESLEQHLLESFLQCFGTIERGNDSAAKRRHAKIIQKFQQLIERHAGEPLYIPQICKRIGVTERTLRACFLEQVGVNPKRFLFLRRMSLTRQALRRAEAGTSTVTDIATTYGFWELGRFSVQYKEIFGESPSTTLRRPAD